ncbi:MULTISPECIES: DUF998 domain-containing protein [unclassified Luteococcus]|uniref:DUF998 domain-containing protein n=1 Tax=unclassified Luteococcus TaxID=2639923 RepID=UPI00313B7A8F
MVGTRRVTGLLLMLGGLFYSAWLLEFLLATDVSPVTSYVSELGADGEPHAWLFRLGDTLAGLSLLVAGLVTLLARRRDGSTPRGELWMYRLLTIFGLCTVLDSSFPMSCVATRDQACAVREAAGRVPWTHLAHGVTSLLAGFALWGAFLVLLYRHPRRGCWIGRRGRRVLTVLFLGWMVATGLTLAMQLPGVPGALLGLVQRAELLLSTGLLLVLGWRRFDSSTNLPPGAQQEPEVTAEADRRPFAADRR